jgi:cell division protein FtsL
MPRKNVSRASVLVSLIVGLLFFYVYQKVQLLRIGYKIRSAEKAIAILQKDNSILQFKISGLLSPDRIAEEVKKLGIDLIPPKEKQIVRVK